MDNHSPENLMIREIPLHCFTPPNCEGVKDCFSIHDNTDGQATRFSSL